MYGNFNIVFLGGLNAKFQKSLKTAMNSSFRDFGKVSPPVPKGMFRGAKGD